MRNQSVNSFGKGLNTDFSSYNTPNEIYIDALNATLINHNGNEFIIQTETGNSFQTMLSEGFVCLGVNVYNGIAYIISHNPTTNEGEIGSFPSPDPSSTQLTFDYRPFQNYLDESLPITPENIADLNNYTAFRTTVFGFQLDKPVEIELQESFDGTVNVIFTDNLNAVRIINSRFSQLPSLQYETIDRIGDVDTNLYNRDSFESTVNLIQRTNVIPSVSFNGVFRGGILNGGNYRYYFFYETQDGNVTDLIEQSSIVTVALGNSKINSQGTREATDKQVSFTITNLDPNYSFLRAYYSYSSSAKSVSPIDELYLLSTQYEVAGGTIEFRHTGFENVQLVDAQTLDLEFSSIEKARTMAQVEGRLILANVSEREYDYTSLREYARTIRLGSEQEQLHISSFAATATIFEDSGSFPTLSGTDNLLASYTALDTEVVDIIVQVTGTSSVVDDDYDYEVELRGNSSIRTENEAATGVSGIAFFNISFTETYSLSAGETMELLFSDALAANPAINVNFSITIIPGTASQNSYLANLMNGELHNQADSDFLGIGTDNWNNGYYNPKNIYHKLGYWGGESYTFGIVYILNDGSTSPVFPVRGIDDVSGSASYTANPTYNPSGWSNLENINGVYRFPNRNFTGLLADGIATINGVSFELPAIPQGVRDLAIGAFFVRAERDKDAIVQGLGVPTLKVPAAPFEGDYDDALFDGDWSEASMSNKKVVPVPLGYFESEDDFNTPSTVSGREDGWYVFREFVGEDDPAIQGENDIIGLRRLALYTADINADKEFLSTFSNSEVSLKLFGRSQCVLDAPFESNTNTSPKYFLSTLAYTPSVITDLFLDEQGKMDFVLGFNENFSRNRFSGKVQTFRFKAEDNEDPRLQLNYNDYLGLKFDSNLPASLVESLVYNERPYNPSSSDRYALRATFSDSLYPISINALLGINLNVYPPSGQRTTAQLEAIYNTTNNTAYFPISKRYTIDELQQESVNGITLFGGDCYIVESFKRVFTNIESDPILSSVQDEVAGSSRLGHIIGFVVESDYNTNYRMEEEFSTLEAADYGTERTFFPFQSNTSGTAVEKINYIREPIFKIPETADYNLGYSITDSLKKESAISTNVPFIATSFRTRIYYSSVDVTNEFFNGYRNFSGLNFEDYTKQYGEIVKVSTLGTALIVVFQSAVGIVGVNDQSLINSSTGSILVDNAGFLNPRIRFMSTDYGSTYQWSVVKSQGTIYGCDVESGKIWRVEGERLNLISDFKIQKKLKEIREYYSNNYPQVNTIDVRASYNQAKADIVFCFYNNIVDPITPSCTPQDIPVKGFTVTFNENLNQWSTFNSFSYSHAFSIYDDYYSIPSQGDTIVENCDFDIVTTNMVWRHNTSPYANYYGRQYNFEVEVIVTDNLSIQKIFNNLKILSNNSLPIEVVYTTDNGRSIQRTTQRANGNVLSADVQYKENHAYLIVQKNSKKRIRDKYARVRLVYAGKDRTFISAVITAFTYSYS